ncbi:MAG TPA: oxalate:formate antiporter [bacterium]|nr:oxalate:formate antiporter [bacterium]
MNATHKTNPLWLILFWAYVGIPLAWSVYSTLVKAMGLFK